MIIGLVGKPSSGKSTFFAASTMATVDINPRPFTTIKPNIGTAYVRVDCIDKEFNVQCNPREGFCINHIRFVPVELIDVAGLIPGAHLGKGLGNQFLNDLSQANVLIHVVDVSGSTDNEGNFIGYGKHDPNEDIKWLENELNMWYKNVLERNKSKMERLKRSGKSESEIIRDIFSSFGVNEYIAEEVLRSYGSIEHWNSEEVAKYLREKTKPIIVAANKMDLPGSEENFNKLNVKYKVPVSAEIELALKRAAKQHLIQYIPGSNSFEIISNLNESQIKALEHMKKFLEKYHSTGVQQTIEMAVYDLLKYIVVFPAGSKLTDNKGNILPDAFLMPPNSNLMDFARRIHTDIANNLLYGIDVRTKKHLGKHYILKHRDGIELVSAAKRK